MKLKNKETCNFAIGQPLVYRKVLLRTTTDRATVDCYPFTTTFPLTVGEMKKELIEKALFQFSLKRDSSGAPQVPIAQYNGFPILMFSEIFEPLRKVVLVLLRHDFLLGIVLKRSDLMLVEVDPKDLNFRLW